MIKVPFGRPDITNKEIKAVVKVLKKLQYCFGLSKLIF